MANKLDPQLDKQPSEYSVTAELREEGQPDVAGGGGEANGGDEGKKKPQKVAWAGYNIGDEVVALRVKVGEILLNTRKAFVFLDEEGNVEWLYYDEPPDSSWAYARVVELEAMCAFFKHGGDKRAFMDKSLSRRFHFDYRSHERSAKRFIGQGVVSLYSGGTKEEAKAAFASAELFIRQRGREVSLIWLYSTFGQLAMVSAIALIILTARFPQTQLFWACLTCAAAGGVGAYISRALASREDLPCDANAGKRLHMEEALLRWSVGVVAGGITCLLIRGKILLGTFATDDSGFPVVLAMAILAGMSERFLPTMLNRFNKQLSSENQPSPGAP